MRGARAIVSLSVVIGASACAASPVQRMRALETPSRASAQYRPGWTAAIALHIDDIRLCLADRQPPTAVVHVQSLATGATGVTAVDGLGQVENCAAGEGRVLLRDPATLDPADLEGLPLFALAPEAPSIQPGVLLEDVEDGDVVIGWLYWPRHQTEVVSARKGEP